MALIRCDECGREISDRSTFCPGCGYPTHLNKALHKPTEPEEPEKVAGTAPATGDTQQAAQVEPEGVPTTEVTPDAVPDNSTDNTVVDTAVDTADDMAESEQMEETSDEAAEDENELDLEPERERRNLRNKIALFISVFVILAAAVGALYIYEDHRSQTADTEEAAADTMDTATVLPVEVDTVPIDTTPVVVPRQYIPRREKVAGDEEPGGNENTAPAEPQPDSHNEAAEAPAERHPVSVTPEPEKPAAEPLPEE